MADAVDAGVQPMKAPAAYPLVYRSLAPTAIHQLPAPHHSVLPPRQLGKLPVVIASP